MPIPPRIPDMGVTPRVAKFARKHVVSIWEAPGRLSGETVSAYPPGVPIIVAGEIISTETIEYLRYVKDNGAHLKGASDPNFQTLKVLSY